ncbi:exodeoxyribonuclease III [Thermopetrobacter sp. TC1]|uniref:exodeoxyribonuclease III n=1 Tax=Thermopetrobacter sp. TC1 TaxID=1495045 RepID=UPI000571DC9A|nr:exodeoxyribonuclease III [Thermopetrobacter sp. TC1]
MKLATWNVNGIRARLETVLSWVKDASPDVLCMQEIKTVDEGFPRQPFEDLGYNVETHGQKGFNGVAILSRRPLEDVTRGLPGMEEDKQARYLEAVIPTDKGVVRVASVYAPNGNPVHSEKFAYKLRWMEAFRKHARALLKLEEPFALGGDYNVIPGPEDAAFPEHWEGDALYAPETRAAWHAILNLGLVDALRAWTAEPGLYTFWDYKGGAWQKNDGIRIDFFLLSPQAADRLQRAWIDKRVRSWEKPSDHVPLLIELDV